MNERFQDLAQKAGKPGRFVGPSRPQEDETCLSRALQIYFIINIYNIHTYILFEV